MAGGSKKPNDNRRIRKYEVGQLFTPATPINEKELFAGRVKQVQAVLDTISQRGLHAVLYGERGVGKTSLANVLESFFQDAGREVVAPRVTCHSADSFSCLWQRIFRELSASIPGKSIGFGKPENETVTLEDVFAGETITPDIVREALSAFGGKCILLLIIDEFDRLKNSEDSRLFADTIKALSDYAVKVTLILVGVADSINDLIVGHESVQRNIVEISVPRMAEAELREIVTERLPQVNMTIEEEALSKICFLSRGLPHYAHLIGQHSAWAAIDADASNITTFHVGLAMKHAIENSQQTVKSAYHKATMSPRRDNLFAQVLLACALAPADEFGYFAAADVREPLSHIMKEEYNIPRFARHLRSFVSENRGAILQEIGEQYLRRFRFRNPLMQPYIIMRGIADGTIQLDGLDHYPCA